MSAAASMTPGPWEAVDRRTVRSAYVMNDKSKAGWEVARLPESALAGDSVLIAAAPDLLEACIQAEAAIAGLDFDGCPEALAVIRAAIAKADDR